MELEGKITIKNDSQRLDVTLEEAKTLMYKLQEIFNNYGSNTITIPYTSPGPVYNPGVITCNDGTEVK